MRTCCDVEHLSPVAGDHADLCRREPYVMFIAAGLEYGYARDVLLSERTLLDFRIMSSQGPLRRSVLRRSEQGDAQFVDRAMPNRPCLPVVTLFEGDQSLHLPQVKPEDIEKLQ